MSIEKNVTNYIEPIVNDLGYELVDVEYKKKYDCMNLFIYIYKDGGIRFEDCEKVHRAINDPLDELDPTAGKPYMLNVSSPGLDRPLKNEKDYKRNINNKVEVSLFSKMRDTKLLKGKFVDFNDDEIFIEIEGEKVSVPKKNITIIKPCIEEIL